MRSLCAGNCFTCATEAEYAVIQNFYSIVVADMLLALAKKGGKTVYWIGTTSFVLRT